MPRHEHHTREELLGRLDEIAALANIPLTAVAPAREDVGRLAVQFLLRKLHSGQTDLAELHIHVLPRIMVRASTGPAPVWTTST